MLIYNIFSPQKKIKEIKKASRKTPPVLLAIFLIIQILIGISIFPPIEEVQANFTDDFSDDTKISSMSRLSLDTNITLTHAMNNTNDTNYLLLYSGLGNDNEILNPVVGHAGDPYYYEAEFNESKHYDYDSDMVLWLNFTTDASDNSGMGNDGTVTGAVYSGEHYEFNGTITDYIEVGESSSLDVTNLTIMVWVKLSTLTPNNGIIYKDDGGDGIFHLRIESGRLVAYITTDESGIEGGYISSSSETVSAGSWAHVAMTYTSGDTKIHGYINGVETSGASITGGTISTSVDALYIGRQLSNYFNGSIDEVAIYNRSLSAIEISTQYNNTGSLIPYSTINYTTGSIGNGSYLNASTTLTFDGTDFYAPEGTISFSAALPDWSVNDDQYFFYTADSSGNYIKISKPVHADGKITFYFVDSSGENAVLTTCKNVSGFDANSWHNFTFTWDIDSDYMECSVDNEIYGKGNSYEGDWDDKSDWGNAFNTFSPDTLCIGVSGHELNGVIDELRILNETYEPTPSSSQEAILESVAFDTSVSSPVFGNISWVEGLPDKTDIEFQISVSDDNVTWTNWTGLSKGLVTLTFDDGNLSHYTNAFPAMDTFGYKGVAYVISYYINASNHMDSTQLLELQNKGWEIGGHSKTHPDLTSLSRSEIITEINDSYQNLTDYGLTQKHFAYPYGDYDINVIDVLSDYYKTARTILNGYNFYNRKYRLKDQDGSNGVSAVQGYIDKAANDSSWLILLFHEIGVPGGESNVDLDDFNTILNYLNSSNVDVVTIDEALGNISYTNNLGEQIRAQNKRYIKYRAIIHSYNGSNTPTLDNVKIAEPTKIYEGLTNTINADGTYTHSTWPSTDDTEISSLSITPFSGSIDVTATDTVINVDYHNSVLVVLAINGIDREIRLNDGDDSSMVITPSSGTLDVTVDTWNTSGTYYKKWTETSTGTLSVEHTVGDLKTNTYYTVKVDETRYNTYLSDDSGEISFTYTGEYSDHDFEVEEDTTEPNSFSLSSPANDSSTSNKEPTLSWNASSDSESGLAKYQLYIDGSLDRDNIDASTTSTTPANKLSCGNHTWFIRAYDNAGNYTDSSAYNLTRACVGGGLPAEAYNPPTPPASTPENPEGGFKILINNDAEITNSRTVTLKLFTGSDTKRMAISTTPDFSLGTDTGQISYQSSYRWDLCYRQEKCPSGIYTVYVKFYTQWGQPSEVVSDAIIFKGAEPEVSVEEMTVEEIKVKIIEIQKKIIVLLQQLIELIRGRIAKIQAQLP